MDHGHGNAVVTLYLLLAHLHLFCSVLQREHQFNNLLHLDYIVDIPSFQKKQAFVELFKQ